MSAKSRIKLSIIAPCYNEEQVLPDFIREITKLLDKLSKINIDTEVIFVDDGSKDNTAKILDDLALKDNTFKVIHFSRNFGHQAALEAGYKLAQGDAIVTIDSDLQDPPNLIIDMIKEFRNGAQIVLARRKEREGESNFKKLTAKYFYRFLDLVTNVTMYKDIGDYRLISKIVLHKILKFKEKRKYWRGIISYVGFNPVFIDYRREARAKGTTHYTLSKMLKLAETAIIGFSDVVINVTNIIILFSLIIALYVIFGVDSFFIFLLYRLTAVILLIITALILKYLYYIFVQIIDRPVYLVEYIIINKRKIIAGNIINKIED